MSFELFDQQCPETNLLDAKVLPLPNPPKNKILILDSIKEKNIKSDYLKIDSTGKELFVENCIACGSPGLGAAGISRVRQEK